MSSLKSLASSGCSWPIFAAVGLSLACGISACWAQSPAQTPTINSPLLAHPAPSERSVPPERIYGAWRSSVIGSGGYLQQIVWAPSDPKRMYLTGDVGGCWRSDDSGQTWHMLHSALPALVGSHFTYGLAVDPQDADKIFLFNHLGVWSSENGGNSFQLSLRGDFTAWQPFEGRRLLIDPAHPQTILVAAPINGFYISKNAGKSWAHGSLNDIFPVDICLDVRDSKRIWICSQANDVGLGGTKYKLEGGLFMTEDEGVSWQKLSDTAPRIIRQDANDPNTLLGIFGRNQVMKSVDNGRTWASFSDGLAPVPAKADPMGMTDGFFRSLDAPPGSIVLGGDGGNLYRLDKGETQWKKVFDRQKDQEKIDDGKDWWWGSFRKPDTSWGFWFGAHLGHVGVDPNDPNHWAFTDWYALYQSHDAGKSWKLTIDGVEMLVVQNVSQDMANSRVVHAGSADIGYFRSIDEGISFQHIKDGITSSIKAFAQSPANPQRLYATGPRDWGWICNQIFVSDNDGISWKRAAMKNLPDMGGKDYRCNSVVAAPGNADEIYTALSGPVKLGAGGVWKSLDHGDTWSWLGQGLPNDCRFWGGGSFLRGPNLAVSPDGTLVAVGDTGGCFRYDPVLAKWQAFSLPDTVDSEVSAFSDDRGLEPGMGALGRSNAVIADLKTPGRYWLARTQAGLWRGDEGGRTWTRVSDHSAWSVAVDFNNSKRIAFNDGKDIYVSVDEGESWRALDRELPIRDWRGIVAFAGNHLVVGTDGNGVFWTSLDDIHSEAQKHGQALTKTVFLERTAPSGVTQTSD